MRFGIPKNGEDEAPKKREVDLSPELEPLGRDAYPTMEQALSYKFQDLAALERAFTHRSAQHTKDSKADYERLEFLGDAVIDLAVAQLLLDAHPLAREGELSKMRAALVNTESLAEIARSINAGAFIRLSRGELAAGGASRPSILADVLEAIAGAVYRDGGFEPAKEVVTKLFGDRVRTVTPRDPKTELQELLHATGSEPPIYLLELVEGPEHAPNFVSVVEVDGQIVGRGRGKTKKASQQAAAEEALARLSPDKETPDLFADKTVANESGDSSKDDANGAV